MSYETDAESMSVGRGAAYTNVTETTIRRAVTAGLISSFKESGRRRILVSELDRWNNGRNDNPNQPPSIISGIPIESRRDDTDLISTFSHPCPKPEFIESIPSLIQAASVLLDNYLSEENDGRKVVLQSAIDLLTRQINLL